MLFYSHIWMQYMYRLGILLWSQLYLFFYNLLSSQHVGISNINIADDEYMSTTISYHYLVYTVVVIHIEH